jgi:hypothetical protein
MISLFELVQAPSLSQREWGTMPHPNWATNILQEPKVLTRVKKTTNKIFDKHIAPFIIVNRDFPDVTKRIQYVREQVSLPPPLSLPVQWIDSLGIDVLFTNSLLFHFRNGKLCLMMYKSVYVKHWHYKSGPNKNDERHYQQSPVCIPFPSLSLSLYDDGLDGYSMAIMGTTITGII